MVRNKVMIVTMVAIMLCSVMAGGVLVACCQAETEEIATEETMAEEITTEETIAEDTATEETTRETVTEETATDSPTHEEIILRDTDICTIDYMKLIDKSKNHNWYAYYLHCDGDLYVVTVRNNHVDVCCMLN